VGPCPEAVQVPRAPLSGAILHTKQTTPPGSVKPYSSSATYRNPRRAKSRTRFVCAGLVRLVGCVVGSAAMPSTQSQQMIVLCHLRLAKDGRNCVNRGSCIVDAPWRGVHVRSADAADGIAHADHQGHRVNTESTQARSSEENHIRRR